LAAKVPSSIHQLTTSQSKALILTELFKTATEIIVKHLSTLALLGCISLLPSFAQAHIDIDAAGTHLSRYGRRDIKQGPCGRVDGERGTNVYTYKPGETITIDLEEFVPHPGYFRIAFDNDGDDDFLNPQTVAPINRECMTNSKGEPDPKDKCGSTDFYNTPNVLMDNLNPHKRDGWGKKQYSWEVTLPDEECDNCTLQIIQVMTDIYPIHAPYDPSPVGDDVYYQCIDLVLEK
jgi:hypothetical protein